MSQDPSFIVTPQGRDRAQEICSMLIANGCMPKESCRDLFYDEDLRANVEQRLDVVGMCLVIYVYSESVGVGLNSYTAADDRLEWSNNFGLERGAMALLLILWAKLILPKRLAQEERQPEDGAVSSLFPELEEIPAPKVSVSREQIVAEFGDVLGGVIMTNKYVAQLSRARLVRAHSGIIEEGPKLALVVDEAGLTDELRREVLISVLRREQKAQAAQAND
jgi:hypothetical protein